MPEETSDCTADQIGCLQPEPAQSLAPMHKLPTLQRHALCKIFDRAEFTPNEVALLGYRRLHQADGIGQKGLTEIAAWLKSYGFEMAPPEPVPVSSQPMPRATRKNIELAVRLLRTHGYIVQPGTDSSAAVPPLATGHDDKAY